MTTAKTSALMRRFRSKDTRPELQIRKAVHALGLRFRVHRPVPNHPRRTIDIAFPTERVAVFVDGCYWHSCPEHGKVPQANGEWWTEKLGRNRARDLETTTALQEAGWLVLRYWEHEEPKRVAEAIAQEVRARRLP